MFADASRGLVRRCLVAVAALLALVACQAAPAWAGQITVPVDRDCTLTLHQSGCFEETLLAGTRTRESTVWWDAAMHFDVAAHLPANAAVTSAKLRVYKVAGDAWDLSSFPVPDAWTDDAEWNSPDGANQWSGALEHYDPENASATTAVDADDTWYEFDVTDMAVEWNVHPEADTGVLLTEAGFAAGEPAEFASLEAGAATAPQLVVTYAAGPAPVVGELVHSKPVPTTAVTTFTDAVTATGTDYLAGVESDAARPHQRRRDLQRALRDQRPRVPEHADAHLRRRHQRPAGGGGEHADRDGAGPERRAFGQAQLHRAADLVL